MPDGFRTGVSRLILQEGRVDATTGGGGRCGGGLVARPIPHRKHAPFITTGPLIKGSLATQWPHSHITHQPSGLLEEAYGSGTIVILILHMEKLRHGAGMKGTGYGRSVNKRDSQDSDLGRPGPGVLAPKSYARMLPQDPHASELCVSVNTGPHARV